jgi:hypothetical protein
MKSLKLGNITKTLGLISAGAMLGIFLLAPLSVGASHDEDEELRGPYTPPANFVLKSTSGQNFSFTLVENGSGELEFVHVPPAPRIFDFDDDDD